jgi:hypothetical protein
MQLIRLVASRDLPQVNLTIPVWYISVTGIVWGSLGITAAWGLLSGRKWSRGLLRWGSLAFVGWYWIDRLLTIPSGYALKSWPFDSIATLVLMTILFWGLKRPSVSRYLEESNP